MAFRGQKEMFHIPNDRLRPEPIPFYIHTCILSGFNTHLISQDCNYHENGRQGGDWWESSNGPVACRELCRD